MDKLPIEELIVAEEATILSAMRQLDTTGRKILFVAPKKVLKATLTDSDIRRYILAGGSLDRPVAEAAFYNPRTLPKTQQGKAKRFMLKEGIEAVPILDEKGRITDVEFLADLDVESGRRVDIPVVVMAGGLGTRLYPYTKILPKPLIPVGEQPIAEHILRHFHDAGCRRFHLIVNYKKNMIKSYFADAATDYDISFVDEEQPLGTGGGLSLLKGKIDDTFFMTNCDVLIDADYADIYDFHKSKGNLITVVCAFKHMVIPYGVIELGKNGEICNVTEKPEMNFLTNTGMYVVDKRVIDEMPKDTPVSFPDLMERYRCAGENIGVYPISENSWMDMGQLEELDLMRRRLEQENG